MADLQLQISRITNADFRRIVVDDATPESLVRLLALNGTMLMMSDEAGSLGNFNGRYTNSMPNLDLLLKSWTGETYISDRITRDSLILYKPYVSICLACQPYIWDSMITNMAFRGSGFLARLLYCFPRDMRGSCKYDSESIPDDVTSAYQKLIYALLNVKFGHYELGQTEEKLIYLGADAKHNLIDFYNNYLQKQLIGEMSFCTDWCGKMHGQLLRLCGIIHCVKTVLNGKSPEDERVTLDTFCNALEILHYFREQTIYAYGLGDTDTQITQAEHIVKKVKSKGWQQCRQNDLYKICRCTLFKNAQDFNATMLMLEEYGYIQRETVQGANGNNKSGMMIHVNPLIYKS